MRLTLFLTCYFATVFLFCFCSAVLFSISLCQVMNTNHRMLAKKHMMQFLCSQQTTINTSQINKQPTNFSKMRVNLHLYHNDFRTNVPFEIVPIVSLSSLSLVFCWNVFHSSGVEDIAAKHGSCSGKTCLRGWWSKDTSWDGDLVSPNSQKNLNEGHLQGPPTKINIQSPETDR